MLELKAQSLINDGYNTEVMLLTCALGCSDRFGIRACSILALIICGLFSHALLGRRLAGAARLPLCNGAI